MEPPFNAASPSNSGELQSHPSTSLSLKAASLQMPLNTVYQLLLYSRIGGEEQYLNYFATLLLEVERRRSFGTRRDGNGDEYAADVQFAQMQMFASVGVKREVKGNV